jgi:hypothetical protein
MRLEEIKSEVANIKADLLAGKIVMSEAIEQLDYIDYDSSALYNALYSSNVELYIN